MSNNEIKHRCTCIGVQLEGKIQYNNEEYWSVDSESTVQMAGEARLTCTDDDYDPHCKCTFEGSLNYYKGGNPADTNIQLDITVENHADKLLYCKIVISGLDEFTGFTETDIFWRPRYWTEQEFEGLEKPLCFIPQSTDWQVGVMYTKNYDENGSALYDVKLNSTTGLNELVLYLSKNEDICKSAYITKNYVESTYIPMDFVDLSLPARFCSLTKEKYPDIVYDSTGKCPELTLEVFPWHRDGYTDISNTFHDLTSLKYNVFRKPFYDELDFLTPTYLDGLDVGRESSYDRPLTSHNDSEWWEVDVPWSNEPDCDKKYVISLYAPCDDTPTPDVPSYFYSWNVRTYILLQVRIYMVG